MPTPLCPLLVAARTQIPKLVVGWEDFRDEEKAASVTDGPMYENPAEAPGVACLGSRCAWWRPSTEQPAAGGCGQVAGQRFADPAGGAS